MLYPTKVVRWIHMHTSSFIQPLFPNFCYFLHLPSYHLPCLPRKGQEKRWPNLHGSPLFLFVWIILAFAGRAFESLPARGWTSGEGLMAFARRISTGGCSLLMVKREPENHQRFRCAGPTRKGLLAPFNPKEEVEPEKS